jgi:hypothetical protein
MARIKTTGSDQYVYTFDSEEGEDLLQLWPDGALSKECKAPVKKQLSELTVEEEVNELSCRVAEETDRWADEKDQWTYVVENADCKADRKCDSMWEFVLVDSCSMVHALPLRVAERFGMIGKEKSSSVRGAGGHKVTAYGRARVCLRVRNFFYVEIFVDVLAVHRPMLSVSECRLAGARCRMDEPLAMSFADGDHEQTVSMTLLRGLLGFWAEVVSVTSCPSQEEVPHGQLRLCLPIEADHVGQPPPGGEELPAADVEPRVDEDQPQEAAAASGVMRQEFEAVEGEAQAQDQPARGVGLLAEPLPEERERHVLTHLPMAQWCAESIAARA